jgi:Region found in RelA / SpoT proteins
MQKKIAMLSRTAVDKAGRILAAEMDSLVVTEEAWDLLENWRSKHAFPLGNITMGLRQKVDRLKQSALVVQRLKRSRSILAKLANRSSMRLTQMQDIGGCRAVVANIDAVYALRDQYRSSRSLHEFVTEDDYIANPKLSGYRSLHLVYRFKSKSRPEYDNLLFEIQLRTQTQHAWATAVETVGAVLGQALKSSQGEKDWLSYFQNAGLALERTEQPALSTYAHISKGTVARKLIELDRQLDVRKKLSAYRAALKAAEKLQSKGAGYFLLVLLPEEPGLQVIAFSKRHADDAHREYARYERQLPKHSRTPQIALFPELADYSGAQVVLVGADSFKSIREAYPNYYLDTAVFLEKIDQYVNNYRRAS